MSKSYFIKLTNFLSRIVKINCVGRLLLGQSWLVTGQPKDLYLTACVELSNDLLRWWFLGNVVVLRLALEDPSALVLRKIQIEMFNKGAQEQRVN